MKTHFIPESDLYVCHSEHIDFWHKKMLLSVKNAIFQDMLFEAILLWV